MTKINIPADIEFSGLRLARDADGGVSFDWAPIEQICTASGLDISMLQDKTEDNVAGLIVAWYQAHLAAGGDHDVVADDLIEEARAEYSRGSLSHKPGTA